MNKAAKITVGVGLTCVVVAAGYILYKHYRCDMAAEVVYTPEKREPKPVEEAVEYTVTYEEDVVEAAKDPDYIYYVDDKVVADAESLDDVYDDELDDVVEKTYQLMQDSYGADDPVVQFDILWDGELKTVKVTEDDYLEDLHNRAAYPKEE